MVGDHGTLAARVAEHPRLVGAVLAVLLGLTQLGTATANHVSTIG